MRHLKLSNSEMVCFRRCKRKWWLSHHRNLVPHAQNAYGSPLSIGNLVHDALALYYDPIYRLNPVLYAQDKVNSVIELEPAFEVEILKEWDLVEIMLLGYIEWLEETGADSDLRFMGSERKVEVKMTDDVTLISKLDAPVEQVSDGAKLALEHKTVTSLERPLDVLKIDTQLLTEHLVRFLDAVEKGATQEEAYDQCHGVLYNMLRKVKRTSRANPPFYGRVTVPHNIHELRNHWKHVMAVASEIQELHEKLDEGGSHHSLVPPSPDTSCKFSCQFVKICHMFDDGSRVEDAVDAMFEVGNPLERYEDTEEL